jgi:hypothetical protein
MPLTAKSVVPEKKKRPEGRRLEERNNPKDVTQGFSLII